MSMAVSLFDVEFSKFCEWDDADDVFLVFGEAFRTA